MAFVATDSMTESVLIHFKKQVKLRKEDFQAEILHERPTTINMTNNKKNPQIIPYKLRTARIHLPSLTEYYPQTS